MHPRHHVEKRSSTCASGAPAGTLPPPHAPPQMVNASPSHGVTWQLDGSLCPAPLQPSSLHSVSPNLHSAPHTPSQGLSRRTQPIFLQYLLEWYVFLSRFTFTHSINTDFSFSLSKFYYLLSSHSLFLSGTLIIITDPFTISICPTHSAPSCLLLS